MSTTNSSIIPADESPRALSPDSISDRLATMRRWSLDTVCNAVDSERSKINYAIALNEFFAWYEVVALNSGYIAPLSRALVLQFKTYLQHKPTDDTDAIEAKLNAWFEAEHGRSRRRNPIKPLSPASINLKLSAVRKLVNEAANNGLMDEQTAAAIRRVEGIKNEGVRSGNWLTKEQAQALVNAPPIDTLRGKRDRAILAVLLLAGLRRNECAELTLEHFQQRDERWAIVDLRGKRGKIRTVPVKPIVKLLVDDWCQAADIKSGYIWRSFRKGDHIAAKSKAKAERGEVPITTQAIWQVVTEYAGALGFDIAPHDCRRTYGKLAHKGGAAIEQISLNLGHSNIEVTEKYLGVDLDLQNAPSDYIDITVDRQPRLEEVAQ